MARSVKDRLTLANVESMYREKGYPLFTDSYDLNLFGVRTADTDSNAFNDWSGVVFTDDDGERHIRVWPITTDPGLYWRNNPMNSAGTAVLTEGYHKHLWKKGEHRGKAALRQHKPCTVWRDNNKDSKIDTGPGVPKQTGIFLINYHRSGVSSSRVDKWSAGCQVTQTESDLLELLKLVSKQKARGIGDVVSYALFHERDVPR